MFFGIGITLVAILYTGGVFAAGYQFRKAEEQEDIEDERQPR